MAGWTYATDPAIRSFASLAVARRADASAPWITTGDGDWLSFAAYHALAGRLAHALGEAGVKPGDRVAVQVDKSVPALALFLACARLGAVLLPLNTAYTAAEVDYFVGDAEPAAILCPATRRDAMTGLARGAAVLTLEADGSGTVMDRAAAAPDGFADTPVDWSDLAAILYTSGTTGRSKGAMLTHGNLASNALSLVDIWRFGPTDTLLHALPIYHTHGLFTATNTLLLSGGRMILRAKFDADDVLARLPEASTFMGVPTFYTRLLQHDGLTRAATRHMRLFVSGSAPLLTETHRAFRDRTGHAILERYGMTETNMNTSNPHDGDRRAGTVGFPLPGVEVRVTDGAGRPLPTGEIGMIEVRGPNVCKGYWRNPQKTAEEFRADGFFITGDLGVVDADGYVSIVGRGKDLIITGGFNVYPKEVESEIDAIPGVVESAVIGLPHPDFGEGVTAVVVRDRTAVDLTETTIATALESRLARFKRPKRVLFVDDLPRNAMGKVQKAVLRETLKSLYART